MLKNTLSTFDTNSQIYNHSFLSSPTNIRMTKPKWASSFKSAKPEKYPNSNLFQKDSKNYFLSKCWYFYEGEEKEFREFFLKHFLKRWVILLTIFILLTFNDLYFYYSHPLLFVYTFTFVLLFSYMLIPKLSEWNYLIIKLVIEIIGVYHMLNTSKPDIEVTIYNHSSSLVISLFSSLLLDVKITIACLYYLINSLVFLFIALCNKENLSFFTLSFSILQVAFGFGLDMVVWYTFQKGIRQWWALYDSFKKSYNILNSIFNDSVRIPCFIVSIPNYKIIHLNTEGGNVISWFKKKLNKNHITSFNDLISEPFLDSFEKNISHLDWHGTRSITFSFPFVINADELSHSNTQQTRNSMTDKGNTSHEMPVNDNKNINSKKVNWYNGDYNNYLWYKVTATRWIWKNKECISWQLIWINSNIRWINYFNEDIALLQTQLDKILLNTDSWYNQYITQLRKKESENPETSNTKHPIIKNFILFFIENQTEFLSDLLWTDEVFGSWFSGIPHTTRKHINLNEILNFFANYFYIFCQTKNIAINYKIKGLSEIYIEYVYFRVILFNILWFVLSNSSAEKQEKIVHITIKTEKIISRNAPTELDDGNQFEWFTSSTHTMKLEINIYDENVNYSYNDILKLLNTQKKEFINLHESFDKTKAIDNCLWTTKMIINQIYDGEMNMSSKDGDNYLCCNLKCSEVSGDSNVQRIRFRKIREKERFYNEIIENIFDREVNHKIKLPKMQGNISRHPNTSSKSPFEDEMETDTCIRINQKVQEGIVLNNPNQKYYSDNLMKIKRQNQRQQTNDWNRTYIKSLLPHDKLIDWINISKKFPQSEKLVKCLTLCDESVNWKYLRGRIKTFSIRIFRETTANSLETAKERYWNDLNLNCPFEIIMITNTNTTWVKFAKFIHEYKREKGSSNICRTFWIYVEWLKDRPLKDKYKGLFDEQIKYPVFYLNFNEVINRIWELNYK